MNLSGNDNNTFDADAHSLSAMNRAVLNSFLAAFGHEPADFEVRIDERSPVGALLGLDDRLVTVRRASTRAERLYVANSYSSWLAELLYDVNAGHYGVAPVRRPVQRARELAAA
jgi:hypothetical protein